MSKFGYFQKFGLLILLSVVLIGCGGGGGGGNDDGTIYFAMQSYYSNTNEDDLGMYKIPSGKTVKFYTSSQTGADPFSADHVFTGITGNGIIKATLPKSLINKQRYIYAVVDINGSFDPREKEVEVIIEAVKDGLILAGQAVNSDGDNAFVTLINGGTIGNFSLSGLPSGPAEDVICFKIPDVYTKPDSATAHIDKNLKVKFYVLTKENFDNFSEEGSTTEFDAETNFEGITCIGPTTIICELPDGLRGPNHCIAAIIVINGDFNLEGKTQEQVVSEIIAGNILSGSPGVNLFNIIDGTNIIDNFEFKGAK